VSEAAFGPGHLDVAVRLSNLGAVLGDQGDLAGAEEHHERALAIVARALGPEHPSTRIVRDRMAALRALGNRRPLPAEPIDCPKSAVADLAAPVESRASATLIAPGGHPAMPGALSARPAPRSEEISMTETPSGGAKYDFKGATIHGSVFTDAVFQQAVTLTHGLGAQPSQQAELAKALEALSAQLAALPDDKGSVAAKAAESAKDVVEAAKPGGDESLFRGTVRSLRGWAEDIAKTVPAVTGAAEQVIKLAGEIRGWLPPGLGG
jgi:hypothetical protein